ncbi:TolB protein [Dyadobacter arcticus]|uniref:TolB protein n=2 Tax=Dyadobacter arcticus TaxID=1078754 RepID=A0ABX0UKU6_9BACT|nr:TolB protein [Dyadobacter arcticus]
MNPIKLLNKCVLAAAIFTLPNVSMAQIPSVPGVTGNAENLTRETSDPSQEFFARVSPDGKFLLYNAIDIGYSLNLTNGQMEVKTNKSYRIVRKEIGKPITNPLVNNAAYPTWLPNSSGVIFSYIKPERSVIVRSDINGVGLNYISAGAMGEDDAEPIVLKDNSKILFTTRMSNSRMICSMDMKGGNYSVITEGAHLSLNPLNNNKIIYNIKVGKTFQVFTMDIKTGEKNQLTTGEYNNRDGAFSRDGKYIAFASNRENPKKQNKHIYVMKADGSELIQITQGETDESDPTWGDDYMLFFSSNAENNYNIWKAKVKFQK